MRKRLIVGVMLSMLASQPIAAKPIVFHTEMFADNTIINLALSEDFPSADRNYDVGVVISLTKTDRDGGLIYSDGGRHVAKIHCSIPAKVMVNGLDYPVGKIGVSWVRVGWKENLWRAVCSTPMS